MTMTMTMTERERKLTEALLELTTALRSMEQPLPDSFPMWQLEDAEAVLRRPIDTLTGGYKLSIR